MPMHLRRFLPLALLLPSLLQAQVRIPQVHATAFSGEPVNLPEGLQGHTAVLIVGFSQASRDAVKAWAIRLATDYRSSPTVLYYEMPILAGVPRLLRGLILDQIRKDVPQRDQARFVPILDQENAWKTAADFGSPAGAPAANPRDAYLLVVDGSGTIRSRLVAPAPTDQSYADLKRRLEAVKP